MEENIYFGCRKLAAEHNEKLKSRAGAAELLGISESSLAHYELGVTKTIPADVIVMMAELYNAPNLRSFYCRTECPIGKYHSTMATEESGIQNATIHLMNCICGAEGKDIVKKLLRVSEDGKVSPEEALEFEPMQEALNNVAKAVSELQMVFEKAKNDDGNIEGKA